MKIPVLVSLKQFQPVAVQTGSDQFYLSGHIRQPVTVAVALKYG